MHEELKHEESEAGPESVTAAPAPPPPAPAPPRAGDLERTLHLERSEVEAAVAEVTPAPLESFPVAYRMASLMVRSGPDTGAKFALDRSPLYFGRGPDNGIVVDDPATSRRHARFEQRGEEFLVVDLGSANGTLVDGTRVVEKVLVTGAVITMGQNELVVSISQEPG